MYESIPSAEVARRAPPPPELPNRAGVDVEHAARQWAKSYVVFEEDGSGLLRADEDGPGELVGGGRRPPTLQAEPFVWRDQDVDEIVALGRIAPGVNTR